MPKKFFSILALLMSLIMIFCACSQNTETEDDEKDSITATTQGSPTSPSDPEELDPPDPSDPSDGDTDNQLRMNATEALYRASSNGYSIWRIYLGLSSTTKTVCVNSEGYVTFEVDGAENEATEVYNDAVIMNVNYDYYVLRSAVDGKMLFDSSANDGAKILLPEHAGKKMFRDGYIMIMKANESFSGVTYEVGFMNPKGEWIQELTTDNALLQYLSSDVNMKYLEQEIVYMGEGILGMLCSDNQYRYYDINTNSCVLVSDDVGVTFYTLLDSLEYNVFFEDGISKPVYMSHNYYLFYSSGKIEQFNVLWPNGYPRADMCGNPYFDRATKTAYFLYDYEDSIIIADHNGNIIKMHENVNLAQHSYLTSNHSGCSGFTSDGYARIILENTEGTKYYTLLNTKGEFVFEPVRLNDNIDRVFGLDGYNIEVNSISSYGYFVVIDQSGKVCYESDYVNDFSVKNGVAYFADDGDEFYIDLRS